jgi:hypothetical protein
MTIDKGEPILLVRGLREVDDAGGQHFEGVFTGGWFVDAVAAETLKLTGNIRPDHQAGVKMGAKTRRKIDRWAEELLRNNAVIGNISVRINPDTTVYDVEPDEDGDLTLTLWSGELDCAVDSLSRIKAILKAAASDAGTFKLDTRFATRIWIANSTLASRVGSDYNTRGDKVNDTAAKFAYQDSAEKRIARQLLQDSPHLGIDNVEVLKNSISASSSKLVAFNTLSQAMESFWTGEPLNAAEEEEQVKFLVDFWDALVAIRPEFGRMTKIHRLAVRGNSMAGTALSIHGIIAVANELYVRKLDPVDVLGPLAEPVYVGGQSTDYFSYDNPIWVKIGTLVEVEGKDGEIRKQLRMSFQGRRAMVEELKHRTGLELKLSK